MILFLRAFFSSILVAMLAVTIAASLHQGLFEAAAMLWPDPWFRATLADAYFGFLTIYCWMAYKEKSWAARALWLVLVMTLGNLAIASYMLIQLFKLQAGDPWSKLLLRAEAPRYD